MIQDYIRDELKGILPELEWTSDYYTAEDNTGTVYAEGGSGADIYESGLRYPSYMVYIRSSDWYLSRRAAEMVHDRFHGKSNFTAVVNQYDKDGNVLGTKTYHVLFIMDIGEPNRIGVDNGIMDYSVNFQVTLREVS